MEGENFINEVSELFLNAGAKNLTMDEIAKHFGMSKKTLYQQYSNKEELLKEILSYELDQFVNRLEEKERSGNSPIENTLLRDECMKEMMDVRRNVFIQQIQKYYPKVAEFHIQMILKKVSVIFFENIRKGRAEGLYREDFNEDLYFRFVLQLMTSFDNSLIFKDFKIKENQNQSEFSESVLTFFLYSIVTSKGRDMLNKILQKHDKTS